MMKNFSCKSFVCVLLFLCITSSVHAFNEDIIGKEVVIAAPTTGVAYYANVLNSKKIDNKWLYKENLLGTIITVDSISECFKNKYFAIHLHKAKERLCILIPKKPKGNIDLYSPFIVNSRSIYSFDFWGPHYVIEKENIALPCFDDINEWKMFKRYISVGEDVFYSKYYLCTITSMSPLTYNHISRRSSYEVHIEGLSESNIFYVIPTTASNGTNIGDLFKFYVSPVKMVREKQIASASEETKSRIDSISNMLRGKNLYCLDKTYTKKKGLLSDYGEYSFSYEKVSAKDSCVFDSIVWLPCRLSNEATVQPYIKLKYQNKDTVYSYVPLVSSSKIMSVESYQEAVNKYRMEYLAALQASEEEERQLHEVFVRGYGKRIGDIVWRHQIEFGFTTSMCRAAYRYSTYREYREDTPFGFATCYDFHQDGVKLYFIDDKLIGVRWADTCPIHWNR